MLSVPGSHGSVSDTLDQQGVLQRRLDGYLDLETQRMVKCSCMVHMELERMMRNVT